MNKYVLIFLFFSLIISCSDSKIHPKDDFIIADGQMPAIAIDKQHHIHIVFGKGDSLMYIFSADHGKSFAGPVLVSVLPKFYSFATRGPQIAATDKGIVVTACNAAGNIYAYYKPDGGNWTKKIMVNDTDSIAKEGLMALSADGNQVYAVWLDLRGDGRNKIYGARSVDAGMTWSKNRLVYASPDSSVCQCCKPSVKVWHNKIYVMFRNWLKGNRDMYLVASDNGGDNFGQAAQIGLGNWKLDGCPMDGGGLAVNEKGEAFTIWRRSANVYYCIPGKQETAIGSGKGCSIEVVGNQVMYAWSADGNIVVSAYGGKSKTIGKGILPVLKSLDGEHMMAVWENDKKIHAAVMEW